MRNNYEWSFITRCKAKIFDPIHYIFIFIDSLQPFLSILRIVCKIVLTNIVQILLT